MIRVHQLKLPIRHTSEQMHRKIATLLRLHEDFSVKIIRKSLDARRKPELFWVYAVDVSCSVKTEQRILKNHRDRNITAAPEERFRLPVLGTHPLKQRPVIIGSGPAGLFCAYLLSQRGFRPIVVERGEAVPKRSETVLKYWNNEAPLNPESNVQFGEGGAGTFSDGKLNTLVKDKAYRNHYVLETFVKHGAAEEILYDAKPHLGTDVLKKIVVNLREDLLSMGAEFLFETRMTDLKVQDGRVTSVTLTDRSGAVSIIDTQIVVLAVGHSARDTFLTLKEKGLNMEQKNFAVGLRMEHPQRMINLAQYGAEQVEGLQAADYKVTFQCENGRSVYSFCMCPGGYVVDASSEENRIAVNGMSYSDRNSEYANAALIVSVDRRDFGSDDVLAGLYYQQKLEEKAYRIGNGKVPIQTFASFAGEREAEQAEVKPLLKGGCEVADLRELFSGEINEALVAAVHCFDRQIPGFARGDALLFGVESRTSSPIRILRGESYESNIEGVYPCGEGAGYAGGITSAAMDGMKVAEAIITRFRADWLQTEPVMENDWYKRVK